MLSWRRAVERGGRRHRSAQSTDGESASASASDEGQALGLPLRPLCHHDPSPGAAAAAFGFPTSATIRCLDAARSTGWSLDRFASCMDGRAVGALRASLGIPSNAGDVERLLEVVATFR